MQHALEPLVTHPPAFHTPSPPPGAATPALAALRPPRRTWMSRVPAGVVGAVSVLLALGWTVVRLADPRVGPGPHSLLRHHSDSSGGDESPIALSRPTLCAVWACVVMLLWSLVQTYRTQGRNCVEREEQYIRDVRFDKLWGAAEAEAEADAEAQQQGSFSSYLWPDLSAYVPGFVLEWTDVCGATGAMSQTLEQNNGAATIVPVSVASPNTTRLLLSKRVPIGSDSSSLGPVAHSALFGPSLTGTASSPQSTPHMLLPTLTSKINGCRRWCRHCALYKPDRAHHCYQCGRCMKKLDHHCSFIGSCIGFSNYKFFLLFLGYAWTGAAVIVWDLFRADVLDLLAVSSSVALMADGSFTGESGPGFILAVLLMLCGTLVIVLPVFLLFHARLLLLEGCTTLEWNEVRPKRALYLGSPHPSERGSSAHPYKLAPFAAWCSVFGSSAWGWFLPVVFHSSARFRKKAAAATGAAGVGANAGLGQNGSSGSSGGASILRTAGRDGPHFVASGSPSTGTDLELDELSAVPLLSSLTSSGSPIGGPAPLPKSVLATFELAAWESRHPVPRAHSMLQRMHAHPLYDQTGVEAVAAAQGHGTAWSSKAARLRAAAQGLLGQEESQLIHEWQVRGLLFPTHPSVVNPQMALWREGKLFKQA